MSQSPQAASESKLLTEYQRGWRALGSMLKEGKSFSGRERHCCFLNTGTTRFADVSAVTGFDHADDGRAIGITDWDSDGDPDIWISNRTAPAVRFLRNSLETGNHFLAIRLEGSKSNRDAIGARVEVVVDDHGKQRKHTKTLTAGDGFRTQSSKELLFGLGQAAQIELLTVRWPNGDEQQFKDVEVDHRYRIVEGKRKPIEQKSRSSKRIELKPTEPETPEATSAARVVLAARTPLSSLAYRTFEGKEATLEATGRPMVINLWSTSCLPCVKELSEWSSRADQLRYAGLNVLLLNVEDIDIEDAEIARMAKSFVDEKGLTFPTGMATRKTLESLEKVALRVFDRVEPLPLPTTFLVDAHGRVAVIYKGPATIKQLINDSRMPAEADLRAAAMPFAGRWIVETESGSTNWLGELVGNPKNLPYAIMVAGLVALFVFLRRLKHGEPEEPAHRNQKKRPRRKKRKKQKS